MILLNILGSGYRLAAEPVETQDGYLAHLVRVNRNATVDSPDSGNDIQDRRLTFFVKIRSPKSIQYILYLVHR